MGDDKPNTDAAPPVAMQCGGPCPQVKRRVIPALSPLTTPFQLGSFSLDLRMVYAPLTRCRALGKHPRQEGVLNARTQRCRIDWSGSKPMQADRLNHSCISSRPSPACLLQLLEKRKSPSTPDWRT